MTKGKNAAAAFKASRAGRFAESRARDKAAGVGRQTPSEYWVGMDAADVPSDYDLEVRSLENGRVEVRVW